jgi:dienelactone hydrolase
MSRVDTKRPAFFTKTRPTPLTITITAEVDGKTLATASIERIFASSGVSLRPLQEEGLVGSLFLPAGPGPHPAVLLLNGSDGGKREHAAALLASRGFAALALAYFGLEDLPSELIRIPLEYFEKALRWLQDQDEIASDHLGVIGLSRGGELALLLGATFPAIKAVVAGAPSGIVQSGVKDNSNFTEPAWTYHEEPLAYMAYKRSFTNSLGFMWHWLRRKPFSSKGNFEKALVSRTREIEEATIPVENIRGPVLLVTGGDDQVWPSARFSKLIIERLARHNHYYAYKHLNYQEAGHFVCFPYALPSMPPMTMLSPIAGMYIAFGGTPKANAAAAIDSWSKILSFLRESLAPETKVGRP